MGRVLMDIKISNLVDSLTKRKKVRSISIKNALVDTGAAMLALHRREITALGLGFLFKQKLRTANGAAERRIFGGAIVEARGRAAVFDVVEVPDDVPVLVGYLILERLDLAVDPSKNRVIPNPTHGGGFSLDAYWQTGGQRGRAIRV